jgi:hypothetical protein
MTGINHNEDFWSLNLQKIRTFHLPHNFGHGIYNTIKKFIGIRPIFTPPHVQDPMMDDANDVYKTHGNNLKYAILYIKANMVPVCLYVFDE